MSNVFVDQYEFLQAGDVISNNPADGEHLAFKLIEEEYSEFVHCDHYLHHETEEGECGGDINSLKECLDLIYVCCQYLNVTIGPDKAKECWDALHANNMSKCTNGKLVKRKDGKVLKPEGYKKLDLTSVL